MTAKPNPNSQSPWLKRVLIPLWVVQLGLAVYIAVETLLTFSYVTHIYISLDQSLTCPRLMAMSKSFYDDRGSASLRYYIPAAAGIVTILNLLFIISVITSIVLFARSKLTTYIFQWQAAASVAVGGISVIFSFTGITWWAGLFIAGLTVVSVGVLVYAVIIRRRVLNGHAVEMKQGRPIPEDAYFLEENAGKRSVGSDSA